MQKNDHLLLFYIFLFGYNTVVSYEGESISNQANLFPVEIQLFFFNVIVL